MAMQVHEGDELLRPTLSRADDLVGMRRPWNPWHLVFATFLGGPLGGGWLLGRNFARLGERRKEPWCLLAFVLLTVLTSYGTVWWILDRGESVQDPDETRRMLRLATRAIATLAAIVVAGMQRRRFRTFQMSGGVPGKLFLVAVVALVLGFLLHWALLTLFVMILS